MTSSALTGERLADLKARAEQIIELGEEAHPRSVSWWFAEARQQARSVLAVIDYLVGGDEELTLIGTIRAGLEQGPALYDIDYSAVAQAEAALDQVDALLVERFLLRESFQHMEMTHD